MGRVLSNSTGFRVAVETSPGVLPVTPEWTLVERDTLDEYGAVFTKTPRRPVSTLRGRKKGVTTGLESSNVGFGTDLTFDAYALFIEGFLFSELANVEFNLRSGAVPPPATGTGYTISAASALLAGKVQFSAGNYFSLVYAKGYTNPANNGLKPITADVAATDVLVTVAGLVAETPPTNASLVVAGIRSISDLTLTVALDGTGTLVSAADITNWAALGVFPGAGLFLGGADSALVLANAFTVAATPVFGWVRVVSTAAGTVTFDKATTGLLAAGAGSSPGTETVDVLIGRFGRNVGVEDNAADRKYLERTYHFELTFPGLGAGGATEYEYAKNNTASDLELSIPLEGKAVMKFGFVGTGSDPLTATRKSGAAAAASPLRTTAFSTATDLVSITTNVTSSVSEVCFKSLTLTIANNTSLEKCLGELGARFVNAGVFEFKLSGQMLFTNKAIVNAIRNNDTVTAMLVLRNDDGAIVIDVPSMTLGGGGREFPVDQSVLVNIEGDSFTDLQFGFDVSTTIFPVVPLRAA